MWHSRPATCPRHAATVGGNDDDLLARHGETDWNLERRVQGHTDRPLNESGRAQALALADRLSTESLDAVYSSDLARARETAAVIAARHGLDVIETSDLREKDFGSWEGMTDTEIMARFPNAHRGEWGDGESRDELADRVVAALKGNRGGASRRAGAGRDARRPDARGADAGRRRVAASDRQLRCRARNRGGRAASDRSGTC